VANDITLDGLGAGAVGGVGGVGALHSVSGVNTWTGSITLGLFDTEASIGVEPDPTASSTNAYFASDWSLTVAGNIAGGPTLHKKDAGHLILPNDNPSTGSTFIEGGWITAQAGHAFGTRLTKSGPRGVALQLADTAQPHIEVSNGASLQLKAKDN